MKEETIKVRNRRGIHARSATLIVRTSSKFNSRITIVKDSMEINAKSIMGVLMLAAEYDTRLRIIAEGEDEDKALEEMKNLFEHGLIEE